MKKIITIISALAACAVMTACSSVSESTDKFTGLELVRLDGSRVVYETLSDIEEASGLIVVGEFVGEAEQGTYKNTEDFIVSTGTLKVLKVIKGEVKEGDKIRINQFYGTVNDRLISLSDLTPMQAGDKWLFFLKGSADEGYWCTGDSDGRYPVRSAENAPMPLSDSPDLGVYNEGNFNRDIYNEIVEKYDI